jgi:hypothetical protein
MLNIANQAIKKISSRINNKESTEGIWNGEMFPICKSIHLLIKVCPNFLVIEILMEANPRNLQKHTDFREFSQRQGNIIRKLTFFHLEKGTARTSMNIKCIICSF